MKGADLSNAGSGKAPTAADPPAKGSLTAEHGEQDGAIRGCQGG
jgi:hypothetical protein